MMLVFSVNPAVGLLGAVGIALVVAVLALVLTYQHPTEVRAIIERFTENRQDGPDALELFYLAVFFACGIAITFTGFR